MRVFTNSHRNIFVLVGEGRKFDRFLTIEGGCVDVERKPKTFINSLTERSDLSAEKAIASYKHSTLRKTGRAERLFESLDRPNVTQHKEPIMASVTKQGAAKRKQLTLPTIEEKRSAAVKATWTDKKVAAARAVHHRVRVAGTEYRSVKEAFEERGLDLNKHIKFRAELKTKGRAKFEGRTFVLVQAH